MSARWLSVILVSLALSWAVGGGSAFAQSTGTSEKTDKLRASDVQVQVAVRLVQLAPAAARRFRKELAAHGENVRDGVVSVDDKQVLQLMKLVQRECSAQVMQAPRITLFNGQKECIAALLAKPTLTNGEPDAKKPIVVHGLRCDVLPIILPDNKQIRLSLKVRLLPDEFVRLGIFKVASGRTLVWHLGDKAPMPFSGQHGPVFVLATPRIIEAPEDSVVAKADSGEEQAIPSPMPPLAYPDRTYPIADLIKLPSTFAQGEKQEAKVAMRLVDLITTTVAKDSWKQMGGAGSVQYFPMGKALVIHQDREAHEEISELLTSLRMLQALRVDVDLKFVQVAPATAKRWLDEIKGVQPATNEPGETPPFLGMCDARIQELLGKAELERSTTILGVPKRTIINGQRVQFEVAQKEASTVELRSHDDNPNAEEETVTVLSRVEKLVNSWRCELQPTVEPNRQSVLVSMILNYEVRKEGEAVGLLTKTTHAHCLTVCTPVDKTLLWHLGEAGGTQGKAPRHLFALMTPRIRVVEPVEADAAVAAPAGLYTSPIPR